MQNVMSIWADLPQRRRVIVVAATLAMFLAVLGLSRMAARPSMDLLYAGLESSAAGDVVSALEARGVAYDVRGDAIFVDSAQRDQLRLTLASEGLPANSTKGYELLDSLSGFGTTSQMFDAAYWRAKEGELARTIVTSPHIASARVHIATQGARPFQRELKPTASVTVATAAGTLSAAHARALRNLIASAVAGLAPEDVAVIDASGGTILANDGQETAPDAANTRAIGLKHNVERLLAARVGPGRAVVEVAVETATETEQISERRLDPDSRVAISQATESRSNCESDRGGSSVTVASNLPDGAASSGDSTSQSEDTETSETINYDVSEVQREVTRAPGAIKRISVAVLVDGIRTIADDGTVTWAPRSEDELAVLRSLVSSAVGLDEDRGDRLTLQSLEFEPVFAEGSAPSTGFFPGMTLDMMRLIQMAVLAIVTIVIGVFVLRPIFAREPPVDRLPAPLTSAATGPIAGRGDDREAAGAADALTGEIDDSPALPAGLHLVGNAAEGVDGPDPVDRLRALIDQRRSESVAILKSWMEDEEPV